MRFLRSPQEIHFRLRQELRNGWMASRPPALPSVPLEPLWPAAEAAFRRLRNSPFAAAVEARASGILEHKFAILGVKIETGPDIDWRRDYLHGKSSPVRYFRRIPFLNFAQVGDHKITWELNRHQHLVLLAQAYGFTRNRDYLDEIMRQLESWWRQNPYQRSMNWASALEVAFRAWAWTWLDHFVGEEFPRKFRARLLNSLGQHGFHLETNLSVYFSPNTHLLGEAVALHALGALYPEWPCAARWKELGEHWVRTCLQTQVQGDGVHFEQSSYYHVYALDMFLAHFLLAGRPEQFREPLIRMAEFLDALIGQGRTIPFIGDDDGGRLFHPYGTRREFGCATLATCGVLFERPDWSRDPLDLAEQAAWWLGADALDVRPSTRGAKSSRLFETSGLAIVNRGDTQVIVDLGPLGAGGAGHSHADTLQVLVRHNGEDVLIDPGTYSYMEAAASSNEAAPRDQFRGTAAHNTVRIRKLDQTVLDQAVPAGPFRWTEKPVVSGARFHADLIQGECRYRGFTHRRNVHVTAGGLVILDEISSATAQNAILEQFWHPGGEVESDGDWYRIGNSAWLWLSASCLPAPDELRQGWRSETYGAREPAPVLCARLQGELPQVFAAVLTWARPLEPPVVEAPVDTPEFDRPSRCIRWQGRVYSLAETE